MPVRRPAFFSLVVGLALDGEVLVGINYDPMRNEMFHAERGKGAFLNDEPIHVSENTTIDGSILGVDLSYNADEGASDSLDIIKKFWGQIQTTIPNLPLIRPVLRGPPEFGSTSRVGVLRSVWSGAVLPTRDENGNLRPTTPWSVQSPDSQWQAQFGMRVTLGG